MTPDLGLAITLEDRLIASLSNLPAPSDRGFVRSLADFLKELPVVFNKAEPSVSNLLDPGAPLERRLRLRELQLSFVYITVLAKKCRVCPRPYPLPC